jgi:acyl-CoA reductase-like NAD-dependent aldehyde dehydrogenase
MDFTPQPRAAWIAGRAEQGRTTAVVTHPADGSEVATIAVPGPDQVERAVAAAAAAAAHLHRSPVRLRTDALRQLSRGVAGRAEELAELITAESGTPLKWSRAEVADVVALFHDAAEHSRRFAGETRFAGGHGSPQLVRRVPRGPVLASAPVTFPLGLMARTVGAALAVGTPVVASPAPGTPLSALVLGELLAETGLPEGAFSVLPLDDADTSALAADPRLPVVSFPGSATAGRTVGGAVAATGAGKLAAAGSTGPAAAVVLGDWLDLTDAATRIAASATCRAGQSCTAVHRVIVEQSVAGEFVPALLEAVQQLRTGNPYDESADVGPMADEAAAARVVAWIDEAVATGAKLLAGGSREGTLVEPALLTGLPADAVVADVRGPVLAVSVVDDADVAFRAADACGPGLRAGLFTRDVRLALRASADFAASRIFIGDVPPGPLDADAGGDVDSIMRELTEERVTVFAGIAP